MNASPSGARTEEGPGRRLRVAYFVPPSPVFAGIERVVHEIATGLATAFDDLDVHVVYATQYDEVDPSRVPYRVHVLGVDRLRHLALALRRCVRTEGFDVLVTPQVEASTIAWAATRGRSAPVVVPHLHGNPRVEETMGSRRTRAAFTVFRRVVVRAVPRVLAVSPSLRDYAARELAPASDVVFVPNPVRDLGAGPSRAPVDGATRFVCVARLDHQKGQDVLLRALALARAEAGPMHLTLVGGGDATALRALALDLGVDDLVTFAGYSGDPVAHLEDADVFVLASRWEGFGVALVEALQCGLPVVATDCEFGPADVVTDDVLGVLVPPEDPEALAAALRDATRWERTPEGDAARRAAAEAYQPARVVDAQREVLDDLVRAGGRPCRS